MHRESSRSQFHLCSIANRHSLLHGLLFFNTLPDFRAATASSCLSPRTPSPVTTATQHAGHCVFVPDTWYSISPNEPQSCRYWASSLPGFFDSITAVTVSDAQGRAAPEDCSRGRRACWTCRRLAASVHVVDATDTPADYAHRSVGPLRLPSHVVRACALAGGAMGSGAQIR